MFARIVGMLMLSSVLWGQSGKSTIQFEDATAASGINFTHSFGAPARFAARRHRRGLRLVRLQQRRPARSLRRQRQAARGRDASRIR